MNTDPQEPGNSVANEITFRSATNADREPVRALVFGVLGEYGLVPEPDGIDMDLEDIEANYILRGGLFEVLADSQGRIVGTIGLYPIDAETVELRKMYFESSIRGKGLGRATLHRIAKAASELGFKRITLETASVLKEAIGLYLNFGFQEFEGFHADRCDRGFYLDL
jgi:putative acetyltransferase